jgi:ribonuclease P protein component
MPDFRFPKKYRILRPAEFERAFNRRERAGDGVLLVFGCENGLPHARLGMAVSRKVGGAVFRNRWKRLIREAFRLSRAELPAGTDLVVVPRQGVEPSLAAVRQSLGALARRVGKRLRKKMTDGE